jgi:hypothetical protein
VGKAYLLDTNIVTKTFRGLLPESGMTFMETVLQTPTNISVINRIELLGWIPDDPEFAADLSLFVINSIEFTLTEEIIQQTIAIRRQVKIKLPDAIIAATAIVHKLILLSDNDVDFLRVPKLNYLNPAKLV